MLAISSVRFLVYCEIQEVNGVFELATSKTQFTSINVSDKVKKIDFRAPEVFIHKVPFKRRSKFSVSGLKIAFATFVSPNRFDRVCCRKLSQ